MNLLELSTFYLDWEINGWAVGGSIGFFIIGLLIGAVATFFITRALFNKQLKENPPINEKQIRAMLLQMGQKPSEARIRQIMKAMEQNR